MAALELTAKQHVDAPAERAWEFLSDTARYAEWVEGTSEVTRTDGPARPGSTYDEVNPIAGPWKGRSHWTVTEFEPPRRQVHRGEGIAPTVSWMEVEFTVEPKGDGACEITQTLRGEPALGPLGRLMLKALAGQVERDNRKSMENAARLIERAAVVA